MTTMNKSLYKARTGILNNETGNKDNLKILYFGVEFKSIQSDIFMARIKSIVKRFFSNVK